ncbi:MAG: hypothetical protein J6N53_15555 [Lachnospiraceae bacterium]|nr:hypothetical protein [Lachnospiraceae bacterium]MBO6300245.1 hypothetical protein [Lachnospiraceae bacterium]
MKRLFGCIVLTTTLVTGSLLNSQVHAADSNDTVIEQTSMTSLGNGEVRLRYSESLGYYLEKDIDQGLEFTILGQGDYSLAKDILTGEYFLICGDTDVILNSERSRNENLKIQLPDQTRGGSYSNPTDQISKTVNGRTLTGVWWGGIWEDIGIAGQVAAVTIATSGSTQSKASVRPGWTANWVSSAWKGTNVRAEVCASCGVGGNQAKWDLQEN